jgi:hypothetical protein
MSSTHPRRETFDFALNLAFSAQRPYLDPEIDTQNIAEVLDQRRYQENEDGGAGEVDHEEGTGGSDMVEEDVDPRGVDHE